MPFCPKCGKPVKEIGLCDSCKKDEIVFKPFKLKICKKCGRIFYKNTWRDISIEKVINEKIIKKNSGWNLNGYEIKKNMNVFLLKGDIEAIVSIPLEKVICPRCRKLSSRYYEAIFQLRTTRDTIKKYVFSFLENSVSDIRYLKEGIDFYVIDWHIAKKLGALLKKKFGGEVKITRKLFSQDKLSSKRIYRVTVLYRLD